MKPWRDAVRALVLEERNRTLLVHFASGVWATPGGGREPGESDAAALARELYEEVGLADYVLGPCLWTREHAFDMPAHCGQRERYYLVRAAAFEPEPRVDLAAEGVTAVRWWTREELLATPELLAPRRLATLVAALLDDGPPPSPIDVGV